MSVHDIVETVARAAPAIRGGLSGRRRKKEEENPSGERQLAADVWADEYLEARLTALDSVGAYASEERDEIVDGGGVVERGSTARETESRGGYSVAVDPLDGSSNLKSNNSMGTILAVYDAPLPASGRDLVAAAYVLYGPITTMMAAVDGEVTEYVIESDAPRASNDRSGEQSDPREAEVRAVTEDVTMPDDPVVYGFGGRVPDWTPAFAEYAREVESDLKLRYGGAMIGDVNQVMTYGGIFSYPGLQSRPEGKLRVQFEGNPMAYIVESAGGASSDGERSLLDVEPDGLHQRTPVHLGNEELVDRLESALS